MALPALFCAGQDPIANRQRGATALFLDPELRCRGGLGFPFFRDADRFIAVNLYNFEYGDFRNSAHLMKRPSRCAVDQSFVRHILQQRLERDLVRTPQTEGLGDFALADRLVGLRDQIQYLLARGNLFRFVGLFRSCHQ